MDFWARPSGLALCTLWTFAVLVPTLSRGLQAEPSPPGQKRRAQWFPLTVKCLQAAQWASWCFCTVWWAGGFVAGQLWWRQAFHYAARSPVRPLPGYKCLGRALKGPARASLPHTALQAILTQVRTRRHPHAKLRQGTNPSGVRRRKQTHW